MNKLKICLLIPVILLQTLCGYSTTNKWAPAVANVSRSGSSPTSANTVNYVVTFTEAVTGVTAASFSVDTYLGLTGASVASVSGSGTIYFVTVNAGTGDGNLRLIVTGTGISPGLINAPYTTGALYTIDKTAPTGTVSINSGAAYTNDPYVALSITKMDTDPLLQMRFSFDNFNWGFYQTYIGLLNVTLPAGDGVKNVYVQLVDQALNVLTVSDNIILDQTAPNTSFLSTPPAVSNGADLFDAASTESGSTFEGSLDGAAFTPVSFPLPLSGLTEGNHSFQVRATDAAGNTDLTPETYNWSVDLTIPVVVSVTAPSNGYYTETRDMDFHVNYNEAVDVVTTGGVPYFEVNIGGYIWHASYVGGTGTNQLTFRYTVGPGEVDLDGISMGNTIVLNGGTIKDLVYDAVPALNNLPYLGSIFVNTWRPSAVLSTTAGPYVNGPFTVTTTFSEPVTGLSVADYFIIMVTVSNLQTSDNITYTMQLTPDPSSGAFTLQLPATTVDGVFGGNPNTASNTLSFQYDADAPFITSVTRPPAGNYHLNSPLFFNVNYNEIVNVTGTPHIGIQIGGPAIRNASYVSGSGTNTLIFRYDILEEGLVANDVSMIPTIETNGGTIKDMAGNDGGLLMTNFSAGAINVDTRRPTVTLSTTSSPVSGPFTVTATFSEAVTGFSLASMSSVNMALAGNLQTTDNITYTFTVTPSVNGNVQVWVNANMASNGRSNGNTASNTISVDYDDVPPVITSVSVPADGYYKANSPLNFTVNTSEVIQGSGTPFLQVLIGANTRQATYVSGLGTNALTFSYVIQDGDMDGIALGANLMPNGATLKDVAGNNMVPVLQSVGNMQNVFVNTSHPSVVLSTAAAARVNTPYTITVTFSEAVTGFIVSDLAATNATVSNLQTTDNITYTALITPVADGAVTTQLPADRAENIGANGNMLSNSLSLTYDATSPAITSVSVPANGYYKANSPLSFTVNTSEVIQGSGTPFLNISVGANTRQATYVSGLGSNTLVFSYVVQDGDMDMDGIALGVNLMPNGAILKDDAGNNMVAVLQSVGNTQNVFVNTDHPSVVLSTAAAAKVNAPYNISITFSEAVTGFAVNDLTVTNATAGNLQTTDNITYTALITPVADGAVTILLPADRAENIGANGNILSNSLSLIYDATSPAITSVNVPPNGYYKENSTLTFTVNTSEVIQGSGAPFLQVLIGANTRQANYVSGLDTNALTFSYVIQNGEMDMDGIALSANLMPNGAVLKDDVGNNMVYALQSAGNTQNVFVNTNHPSVVLSTAAAAKVNAPYTITITFSEAVTGFAATDLTATNATISNLQTTNNITYTALVTPSADGAVTTLLPADRAENIGANGNAASNTLSLTYDGTAPVINAGQTFNALENNAVGTVAGTVTATEANGTLQNWTIATDGSGGAFSINTNGTITVKDVALLNSKAGTTVTLNITVSDGLNTSAQATVTIAIGAINKAPFFGVVADREICITTATQTFPVTGATATEAGQTFGFTISADQQIFDALTIDAAGVVSYKLKTSATGKANITIIIKDNGGVTNGGVDVFQRTFALTVNSLPVVNITSNKGSTVSKGTEVQLTASGAATYNWGTATGAVFTIRPQANTTYTVTGANAAGCEGTAQITLNIIEDFKVDAANLLTPNGDGINDKWVIRNISSYPDNELKIFDRGGRMIYQRRNYNNEWDGTMNGQRLAEGTYYYILTIDGSGKTVKGYITIITDRK
ncbi:T9SS type B sorting domain-containing protein [Chitinophaga sp. SYP-B3965]|uniref:Ig-like domain-containing protein n=1 Tax=Chitinophaga sp. SYP-B3965 TaxID=2663120 RepID=UPI00129989A4|nr:Ig-like domain-containing protein [Chitinophaga sp. SYP-B3965]MRG46988.1 T9SS type B sorting domain-containing protein [Chitinophaga sp. SYP-B3965]